MTMRCARAFSPRWNVSCSIGVDFKAMLKLAWQSSRLSRAGTTHTDVIRAWTISLPWRMKRGITTWSNSNVQLSTKPGQLQAALKQVFDHEEKTHKEQMSAEARLAYHQAYSA